MPGPKAYRCKYCKSCYYTTKELVEHKKAAHPEIFLAVIQRQSIASSLAPTSSVSVSTKQGASSILSKQASGHVLQELQPSGSGVQCDTDEPNSSSRELEMSPSSSEQNDNEMSSVDHQDSASGHDEAISYTAAASDSKGTRSGKQKRVAQQSEDIPRPRPKKGRRARPVESARSSENEIRAAPPATRPRRPDALRRTPSGKTSCITCGLTFRSAEYRRHADICGRNLNKFSNNLSRFIRFFRSYEGANLN